MKAQDVKMTDQNCARHEKAATKLKDTMKQNVQ